MRKPRRYDFSATGHITPGRSAFDLSYSKLLSCDMGQLIPVMVDEVVPGDIFKIYNEAVVRTQPLVAPILHNIDIFVHYFFVPYRLLWTGWEDFITGGLDGEDAQVPPTWKVSNPGTRNSLWDYMGFPYSSTNAQPAGACPLDFPRRAYALIYNSYYVDETIQDPVEIGSGDGAVPPLGNELVLYRNWAKDYLTSAQISQQRGIAPSIPLTGQASAIWADNIALDDSSAQWAITGGATGVNMQYDSGDHLPEDSGTRDTLNNNTVAGVDIDKDDLNDNLIDLTGLGTFNMPDLRLLAQIQRWQERNQRCGARYVEFILGHFGIAPRDERLQRPEYFGGTQQKLIVSEVLQTSKTETNAPQGNLAGKGLSVSQGYAGTYHVKEFGLIMGIMSIMPKGVYTQGINRQWLRKTRYDFYFPEFAHLSEQGILNAEIFTGTDSDVNNDVFGYQGFHDEMRYKPSMVVGDMRGDFKYWHLAREFSSLPNLNSDFLKCDPRKDIFAVSNVPGFIVEFGNLIHAIRPIPYMSNPGLMDH